MAFSGVLNFHAFALFLCVTSALTLTVNDDETAANYLLKETVRINTVHVTPKVEKLLNISNSKPTLNDSATTENSSNALGSVPMEGGGSIVSTPNQSKSATAIASTTPRIASDKESISREKETGPVTQKPTVQKIFPRKGADQMLHRETEASRKEIKNLSEETHQQTDKIKTDRTDSDIRTIINNDNNTSNNDYNDNNDKNKNHTDASEASNIKAQLNDTSNTVNNPSTVALEKETMNITTPKPDVTTRKHKPKPTATVGGSDIDKPIPASPTKSAPLGTPSKIDYIVPVVITIIALPILGAIAFIMYSRGRDCWDKRHYRRMDFLIDGMYND